MKSPKIFMLLFIATSSLQTINAQVSDDASKNIIYATLGLGPTIGPDVVNALTASVSYNRLVVNNDNRFFNKQYITASFGSYGAFGLGLDKSFRGTMIAGGYTLLTGKGKHHLEIPLKAVLFAGNTKEDNAQGMEVITNTITSRPSVGIGYRYQKPGGSFVFRTGYDSVDAIYLSFGFTL